MIIDHIQNIHHYQLPQKGFQILKTLFLNTNTPEFIAGKTVIEEPFLYKIGLEYSTKRVSEGVQEAHINYLDVHYILEGQERVTVGDIKDMNVTKSYDSQKDCAFFEGPVQQEIILRPGNFLLLYPHEVHQTGIAVEGPEQVKKIVFKILF